MRDRLAIEHARATLDRAGRVHHLFGHGSLEVEIYRPVKIDRRQPQERDEIYVVISGTGSFVNGGPSAGPWLRKGAISATARAPVASASYSLESAAARRPSVT